MPYTKARFDQDLMTIARRHYHLDELKLNPWDANRTRYASPADERCKINLSQISKNTAWAVYHKVFRQAGDMYMGRLADTGNLLWVFGLDAAGAFNLTPGLPINVQKLQRWSVCINDCWILGAIHSQKRIILETPIKGVNDVWDNNANRYFVTGRELIGLERFGYVAKQDTNRMVTFVCRNRAKAMGATLQEFARVMSTPRTTSNFEKTKTALFAQLTFNRH